jgi:hypothetical protein
VRFWRRHARTHLTTSGLVRPCGLIIAATAALTLVPITACSGANPPETATTQSHTLVAYKEEQSGIVFRHTSLIVSTRGQATVRFERCVQRLHLDASLWKRLKAALKQTNVHALVGNHVPATPRAEESTWVIVVGHDTVRITASSIPPELRVKLEPLLKVLGEAASVGKRDMPQSCSSKRTVNGTG